MIFLSFFQPYQYELYQGKYKRLLPGVNQPWAHYYDHVFYKLLPYVPPTTPKILIILLGVSQTSLLCTLFVWSSLKWQCKYVCEKCMKSQTTRKFSSNYYLLPCLPFSIISATEELLMSSSFTLWILIFFFQQAKVAIV